MKDIKFRQPVFDEKGLFSHFHYWGWISKGNFVSPLSMAHRCMNEKGQQYTRLQDKKGVEIYEGDILSNKDTYGYMVVNWSPTSAGFCLDKKGWIFSHYFKEAVDAEECEVIGNIYEDPELLKG